MVRFWLRGSLTFYSEPGCRLLQGFKQVGNVVKTRKYCGGIWLVNLESRDRLELRAVNQQRSRCQCE
jgi:hypothetical protein